MNLKISREQIRYSIEGNKVVAVITDCKYMLSKYCDTAVKSVYPNHYYDLELKNSYIGVANCDPEDEFNLITGKRIAAAKAIKILREDAYKKYVEFVKRAQNDLTRSLHELHKEKVFSQNKYRDVMIANGADVECKFYFDGAVETF